MRLFFEGRNLIFVQVSQNIKDSLILGRRKLDSIHWSSDWEFEMVPTKLRLAFEILRNIKQELFAWF